MTNEKRGLSVQKWEGTVTSNAGGGFNLGDIGFNFSRVISVISQNSNYYCTPPYGSNGNGWSLIKMWNTDALQPNTTISVVIYYTG